MSLPGPSARRQARRVAAGFNHALQRTASPPCVRASREFASAPCAPPALPRPSLSSPRWVRTMKLSTTAVVLIATLAAEVSSAELLCRNQLNPQTVSTDETFAFTVHGVVKRGTARFKVSVTPKRKDQPLHVEACVMVFDGKGQIQPLELEGPREDPRAHIYEFEVNTNYLAYSQFVLWDIRRNRPKEARRGDSWWFYLRDFAVPAPNPQGGANGRQPVSSETNRTSGAAASRRSP